MTSQIYRRFTKAIRCKVTTLPPKPKSQTVSELLHFWWRMPLRHLVFDELKMTSLLLALGLIITLCWEHTAMNGGREEWLKHSALVTSSLADMSETNWLDFKIDLFFQCRQFSMEDSGAVALFPHKTAPISIQCIFQGSTSVSLVAHSSKVSPVVARVSSELNW